MTLERYLDKNEFLEFLDRVKNPQNFLQDCKRYHEFEKWDIVYVIANKLLQEDKRFHKLAAADIVLMVWNMPWYHKASPEMKKSLDERVLKLIDEMEREIRGKKFPLDRDFTKEELEFISNVFERFKTELGPVGASKVLHILNPEFFPAWDGYISYNYHKYYPNHTHDGKCLTTQCYVRFCVDCQEILKELLKRKNLNELWEEHKKDLGSILQEFPEFKESPLKMLDECSYVNITKKIKAREERFVQTSLLKWKE